MEDTDVIHEKIAELVENRVMREFIADIIDIEQYHDAIRIKMDKYDKLLDKAAIP